MQQNNVDNKTPDNLLAVLEVSNLIAMSLDLEDILQKSVDIIVNKLNLESAVIFINEKEKEQIRSIAFTAKAINKIAIKLIPKSFNTLFVNYKNKENFIVKTVLERKNFESQQLS